MSSKSVKGAIADVLEHPDFDIESPRVLNAKSLARRLLEKTVESEVMVATFDAFAEKLLGVMQTAYIKDKRFKYSTKRERMWSAFHSLRGNELRSLWGSLMRDVGLKNDDTGT